MANDNAPLSSQAPPSDLKVDSKATNDQIKPHDSPTGVADEKLTISDTARPSNIEDDSKDQSNSQEEDEQLMLTDGSQEENRLELFALQIQTTVMESIDHVKRLSIEAQQNVVVDRKTITSAILTVIAMLFLFAAFALCCMGGMALLTLPFWLPCLFLTSPIWIPVLFFTSPVWLTVTIVICGSCIFGSMLVVATVLFFSWPAEWLPRDDSACKWCLRQRDVATVHLVKLQAKLVLYGAGVGPVADGLFLAMDKVDLAAAAEWMREFDLQEFTMTVKQMSPSEMQAAVVNMLMGIFK